MKTLLVAMIGCAIAVLSPFEAAFAGSARSANDMRRRALFRLPYGDPARESLAREIHDVNARLARGGAVRWLRDCQAGLRPARRKRAEDATSASPL